MRTLLAAAVLLLAVPFASAETVEKAVLTTAPGVPPAITRRTPAVVTVALETREVVGNLMESFGEPTRYAFWTFNWTVPGPFIRVREGDTLEVTLKNSTSSAMKHNIDLHAVTGPGGGAAITLTAPGETTKARFKMLAAGFYVYHCAAPPVTDHIANGMYGAILVEPKEGLPKVDREFYVLQSEFYTKQELGFEGLATYAPAKAADETPTYIVFNGKHGSLTEEGALQAKTGDKVRIFFANAGPNKTSSFHIIGTIFDKVYREGGIGAATERNVQTTVVPPGGATIVEFQLKVPGDYSLVDHAIFRLEKGAAGVLHVEGPETPELYAPVK